MAKRTGASRVADVPAEVLAKLNSGELETATLAEGLAIDFHTLLQSVLPKASVNAVSLEAGITTRMKQAAQLLLSECRPSELQKLQKHPSDTVRGWVAFAVGLQPGRTLEQRLDAIRGLADDSHFGVREWAWLAVRDAIAAEIVLAIELLGAWTREKSEYIRRFASEATRPRGVWCAQIPLLKNQPALGLPILEPLRSDSAKYVRDSVANWLNDAGKSQPDWVTALCQRWTRESKTPETAMIVQRAMRNL
jgi:3-methyladenine DNA glycosylase AlkC